MVAPCTHRSLHFHCNLQADEILWLEYMNYQTSESLHTMEIVKQHIMDPHQSVKTHFLKLYR